MIRPFDVKIWMNRKDVMDKLAVNDWWRKTVVPSVPNLGGVVPAGVVYLHPADYRTLVGLHGGRSRDLLGLTYLDGLQIEPDPDVPRRTFDLLPPE